MKPRPVHCLVPVFSAVIGTILFHRFSLLTGLDRVQADTGDSRFVAFLLEHWRNAIWAGAAWNSPPIFWPARNTLAYSELLVGMGVLHSALRTFFGVFAAMNLQLVLLSLGTFAAAYALFKRGFALSVWGRVGRRLLVRIFVAAVCPTCPCAAAIHGRSSGFGVDCPRMPARRARYAPIRLYLARLRLCGRACAHSRHHDLLRHLRCRRAHGGDSALPLEHAGSAASPRRRATAGDAAAGRGPSRRLSGGSDRLCLSSRHARQPGSVMGRGQFVATELQRAVLDGTGKPGLGLGGRALARGHHSPAPSRIPRWRRRCRLARLGRHGCRRPGRVFPPQTPRAPFCQPCRVCSDRLRPASPDVAPARRLLGLVAGLAHVSRCQRNSRRRPARTARDSRDGARHRRDA